MTMDKSRLGEDEQERYRIRAEPRSLVDFLHSSHSRVSLVAIPSHRRNGHCKHLFYITQTCSNVAAICNIFKISSTDFRMFRHRLPIAKHVHACDTEY